ncbi:MAG: DNA cytosine methyltransferase, partial [Kiritimatiellae bacterium]|nr:DNA cytosine methyltransferase [Kiritimatiellia bacterium]
MPTDECELTYATVCSGIECMSAAVAPLGGWRPVFFSEIEPFPCALLKHRYPTVPNLGDMTKIKAEKIGEEKWRITNGTDAVELAGRLGCLAGGTPCQDVSVAGKRAGMAEGSGTRSSLAFHFARLCRELQPRWVLWENVPGVLTSNGGRDFAHFARAVGECGYSLAYRVLDAQWVRVDGLPRG